MRLDHSDDALSEVHEINVTPFIDVMLVLLIIFMVAAPLATVDIKVNLPAVSAEPQQRPDEPLYLTLKSDLSLALGDESVSRERLPGTLDAAAKGDKDRPIYLRADKTVPYGEVMEVMNLLRAAGYLKMAAVVTWRKATVPAEPPGPVVIELAPMPAAPTTQQAALPPAPEQVPSSALPDKTAEKVEQKTEEKTAARGEEKGEPSQL